MKRLISMSLVLAMLLGLCLMAPVAVASETTAGGYYYKQLTDATSKKFYDLLVSMKNEGYLQSGTYTADLVEQNVLANQFYEQEALMKIFTAARDAFMFDHADLFYVDFEKLSITATQTGTNYSYTMGVGRDTNYFRTGFDRSNVKAAISDFDGKVSAIASAANAEKTLEKQIKAAYEGVMNATEYALEAQAKPENVNYVRTPYGALVKGQSVCEGYARALKAVLDEMGIENVLVQGYYTETIAGVLQGGAHMWNYVKMDDNRWYLLDATIDDGNEQTHFLLPGISALMEYYRAEGQLSPSDVSSEFSYPTLSPIDYQPMTEEAFVLSGEGYEQTISYRGMGILASREEDIYLLGSYDGTTWLYIENHVKYMYTVTQGIMPEEVDLIEEEVDAADCFGYYPGQYAYLAATETPRPTEFDKENHNPYLLFDLNSGSFFDMTQIGEAVDLKKSPPYVVSRDCDDGKTTTLLEDGQTVNVTVTYSEDLKQTDYFSGYDLILYTSEESAKLSNFKWDSTNPRVITFTLQAGIEYGHTVNYFLYLTGLVGADSGQAPDAITFSKLHLPKFSCPKVASSINQIHSNIPALISDSDLSADGWKYADGSSVGENLPFELALVASELPSEDDYEELPEGTLTNELMEEKVEEVSGEKVLASKTYDISLSLCSGQVSYIQGRRVKVFVPFPDGYNVDSNVSYKAYHYDEAKGIMEEIECVVVEGGIIMMCESFSPFTVVAVEKEAVIERTILTHADGNGSFGEELVTVKQGNTAAVTVIAKSGYVIDKVTLNGTELPLNKLRTVNDQSTVYIDYNQTNAAGEEIMKDTGNVLEASFVLESISTEVPDMNSVNVTSVTPANGVTLTAPEGGWVLGENTFTVTASSDAELVVAVSSDFGATYTRLYANSETPDTYTVTLTADSRIMAGILGDTDNSGAVDSTDLANLKAACLKEQSPNAQGVMLCDMNQDSKVNVLDLVKLKIAVNP